MNIENRISTLSAIARLRIQSDNRVVMSRVVPETESDHVLDNFLNFLAQDMKDNPQHIHAVSSDIVNRAKSLVDSVDFDLDAPLLDEDE